MDASKRGDGGKPGMGESMIDETEDIRRAMQADLNSNAGERSALEAQHGKVWALDELRVEFEILQFAAPFVIVKRLSDGVRGSVKFQHSPRFYFEFHEE